MKKTKTKAGRNAARSQGKGRGRGRGRPFQRGADSRRNIAGQRSRAAVEQTKKIRAEIVTELDREVAYTLELPGGKKKKLKARNYELLARKIVRKAVDGDYQFVSLVLDRVEGKVPMPIQGGDEDKPVYLKIVPAGGKG